MRERLRVLLPIALAVAIVVTVGAMWFRSLVPDTYSVMDHGEHDYGGGPVPTQHQKECSGVE